MAFRSDGPVALVTGAGGFTGHYVREALTRRGYRVVGWTHQNAAPDAALEPVDLLDADAVRTAVRVAQPDVVMHLAAIAFVGHGDVDDIYRVNICGTRHLLHALSAIDAPPRHVILASSANIYGNAAGQLNEDTPASPQNDYAVSKLAMEHVARLFAPKLPLTLLRPFNYTGVGQSDRFLIPKIVNHFRTGASSIELGNLDVWREFNDVRDVAEVYARLVDLEGTGEALNVCSGNEYSLRDVVSMMERISGNTMEIRVNPAFVRASEVVRLRGDPARLAGKLGGLPQRSLEHTLAWMYESKD